MRKFLSALFGLTLFLLPLNEGLAQNTNAGLTPVGTTQSMSVTTSSSSITLNASPGTSVLVVNTGTNTAYIKGGVTATTSDFPVPAGWGILMNYPPGQAISAITASSTTTLTVSKGTGDTAFTGGSGSSGGGGGLSVIDQAVFTQGTSPFTPSGGVYNDSATLTSGQQGTYRLTTKRAQIIDVDTTGSAIYSAIIAPVPAGTNLIGKVSIDQTTPGTTNAVAQSGTWVVQPGNTPNTTPWVVNEPDGLALTTTSLTATGTLFTQDMLGYQSITVQVTSNGGGSTITYETSEDNSTWVNSVGSGSAFLPSGSTGTNGIGSTSTGSVMYTFPKRGRYFRARVSTYISGTVSVVGSINKTSVVDFLATSILNSPAQTLASAAVGGAIYAHIAAGQATTVVKNTAGTLYSITFNGAATATNTTTLYDNATGAGTVIGIPAVTAVTAPETLNFGPFGINFALGLTIITASANGADMTVVYK